MKFDITYEIVTPESAEHGDVEDRGFSAEGLTLREAHNFLRYDGCALEADSWPISLASPPRWLTFAPDIRFEDGAEITHSLHLPRNITPSSAMRVARLFGLMARSEVTP